MTKKPCFPAFCKTMVIWATSWCLLSEVWCLMSVIYEQWTTNNELWTMNHPLLDTYYTKKRPKNKQNLFSILDSRLPWAPACTACPAKPAYPEACPAGRPLAKRGGLREIQKYLACRFTAGFIYTRIVTKIFATKAQRHKEILCEIRVWHRDHREQNYNTLNAVRWTLYADFYSFPA